MKAGIGGKLSIGGKIGGGAPLSRVFYHIQMNDGSGAEVVHIENRLYLQNALIPSSFVPSMDGYDFYGWREDATTTPEVLSSKIVGINEEIHLYAVFRKPVTVTYVTNNNNVTAKPPAEQNGYAYLYYDGTITQASFILANAHESNTDSYLFRKWAMGSSDGELYDAGAEISLSDNITMYARWYQAQTQSASGTGACHMIGTFQDGGSKTETVYYAAFASTPTISITRVLTGWGPDHSYGGSGSVVSVGLSSAVLSLNEWDNAGNNYNYGVYLDWTATGKRWVAI